MIVTVPICCQLNMWSIPDYNTDVHTFDNTFRVWVYKQIIFKEQQNSWGSIHGKIKHCHLPITTMSNVNLKRY